MNEKRFQVINVRWQGKGEAVAFEDTQTNQVYFAENQEECKRIVELLNEQQSTISYLNERITELLQYIKKLHRRDDGMSEKRFEIWKINSKKNGVKDNQENAYYSLEEFLDWLNEKDKHIGMESIMSDKRFDNIEISEKTVAFYDNGEFTALDENGLGKLLNRLHRENIYLSRIRENQQQMILNLYERNEQLLKKNKILEEDVNDYQEDVNDYHNAFFDLHKKYDKLEKENEKLRKKLECCEYEHFLNELDEIHEKVDKGDLSDFNPLKEDKPLNDYNPLKEKLHYWQCKYYRKDYEHKMDMCTRCNYGGLLNYCLKDKCDKIVKKDYEVTINEFKNGMSITWKKEVDMR